MVMLFLTARLYGRYKERGMAATKYLTATTLFLSFTSSFQLLDMLLFNPFLGLGVIGYSLAFAWSAVANIYMCFFMFEIFGSGWKVAGVKPKIFIGIEAAVVVLSPTLGLIDESMLLYVLIVHMAFALVLYFSLVRMTTKAIAQTADETARKGFSFIRAGGFTIALAYISFVLDRVMSLTLVPEGYSYFTVIGWIFAAISGILLYTGFVLPSRNREAEK